MTFFGIFFLVSSDKVAATVEKLGTNFLYYPQSPKNDLTSFLVWGSLKFFTADTLQSIGLTEPFPTT